MRGITRENNFVYLCLALLGLLFSSALMTELSDRSSRDLFSLAIVLMLVLSIKSLHAELTWKRVVLGLAGVLALLGLLSHFFPSRAYEVVKLLVLLLFFTGSFASAYRQILFTGRVDSNKLVGSLSLYLLLGLIWTVIYLLLLIADPGAFSGIDPDPWQQSFSRAAYYSFITLTTLGYGDILPTSRVAEFFAYLEAIAGVFYMAIVVASLVSVGLQEIQQKTGDQERKRPGR